MRSRGLALSAALFMVACTRSGINSSAITPRPKATAVSANLGGLERGSSSSPTPLSYPVRWDREFGLDSLADVEARFQRLEPDRFGELSKDGRSIVPQNCAQWSQLHGQGYFPTTTVEEQPDGYSRIRCMTFELLRRATPARTSSLRDLVLDDRALSVLPAAIATELSSEGEQAVAAAERAGKSLHTFNPRARGVTNPDTGVFEIYEVPGEPSSILLAPKAWGDFTHDGEDDLLLSVINVPGGSTHQFRLLLLTRSDPGAVLRVVSSY